MLYNGNKRKEEKQKANNLKKLNKKLCNTSPYLKTLKTFKSKTFIESK